MRRRDFLKKFAFGAALSAAPGLFEAVETLAAEPAAKPNIVMILVDDLGYGDLSSYGAKDLKSPHIDALMSAGLRIDNFYANCPVCSPTRAALLSGRYPDMVGVPGVVRTHIENNWGYLSEHAVLLPKVLKRAGYHTGIVGKWHLGLESPNTPNEHGFDHFHGFLGDMMDDYYHHRRDGFNFMRLNDKEIDPEGHATDLFTQWAIDYIGERAGAKQPFFLYLAYNAPHTPIQPPKEWVEKVGEREKGISERRAKLVALIEHLDDGIGKVVAALKACGAADNTLVIFASDNGGQINVGGTNGALRAGKQDMYEGGIKAPFCAVWPGRIAAGGRNDECFAMTMDLYPTMCEAAGATFEHEIDGRSILPVLLGRERRLKERTVFWVRREGGQYGGRAYYAVRRGDWKLLQNSPYEAMELYNLKDDPLEAKPLPRNHAMYRELFAALRRHVTAAGAVPWQKWPVRL
ncbi:MAG: sulfatase-like hydrolase/transferase [Phycisphaerae bacterium]|nr:sulfatase-like hydrolase/transferase [Phycisphaerae bacterium]